MKQKEWCWPTRLLSDRLRSFLLHKWSTSCNIVNIFSQNNERNPFENPHWFRILLNMAVEQGDRWPTTKLVMLEEAAAAEASPDSLGSHMWRCHQGSAPRILIVQAGTGPWAACWGLFGRFLAVLLLSFLRYPSCWGFATFSPWGTDLSLGISPTLLTLCWELLLSTHSCMDVSNYLHLILQIFRFSVLHLTNSHILKVLLFFLNESLALWKKKCV